jgi:transposase
MNGARAGDLVMSLIHTCELCGANSFDYLTELHKQASEVAAEPGKWMPWSYRERLSAPR